MMNKYNQQLNEKTVKEFIYKEIGYKFARALENTGVFKQTKKGRNAFKRFINVLN